MKKNKETTLLVWSQLNDILKDERTWGFIITPENDEDFPDLLLHPDGDLRKTMSFPYNEPYEITAEETKTAWRVMFPWECKVLKYSNSLVDVFGQSMDDETAKAFIKAAISCFMSVMETAAENWGVEVQEYPKGREEFTPFIQAYMESIKQVG